MERKFLKELGIADESIEKIMAENGKDIEGLKSEQSASKNTLVHLQQQIKERDKQLETLKKTSGDKEELKKQISDLQTANKTAKAEYEAHLKKVVLDSKIETALLGAKAKNTKAARALLDESKISLDGDNLLGMNEQIEAIKKENAYLFDDGKPQNPPAPYQGDPAAPDWSALPDDQYFAKAFETKK